MMKSVTTLPGGYRERLHIDLQKDKRTALLVNIAAAVVMVGLVFLGSVAFRSVRIFPSMKNGVAQYWISLGVLLAAYLAYIVLHELTHALVMKLAGAQKLRFGFTGLYAYAGSAEDYFDKPAYLCTALAPLVLWGVVFTVAMLLAPSDWFWLFYLLQVGNIAGAAGDVYVFCRLLPLPKDLWARDTGTEMFVYAKE